ncbi:MAG: twin-arginine translocation pathway signal protein [Ahrensia sp.]|nr:twin-arginine translocation pathway signal protein [Ahrensia sp.]
MNRRKFLTILGGGVILAAGAGAYRLGQSPQTAFEPWARAGTAYAEPRRKALSYAILAPNPHNMQPWLVDLSQPGTVILSVDPAKMLPHTDPHNRQITIGLGCFLELMVMAAAQDGYRVGLELFPQGEDAQSLGEKPVAIARFVADKSVQPDPLFVHVMDRRSVKEPYDTSRTVERTKLNTIVAAARDVKTDATSEQDQIAALRNLTTQASTVEMETPRTHKESVDVFRIGAAEIDANPDGIDLSGPMIEALSATGLLTREGSLEPGSTGFEEGRKIIMSQMATSMGFVWLVSPANTRLDQIKAGRDWVRVHLAATGEGISVQPTSQALQEYAEMEPFYNRVHEMLAPQGGTVQMLARLGYHEPVPASPRWPLEAKIVES